MIVSIELQKHVNHFIGCSHCFSVFDGFPLEDLGDKATLAGWTVIGEYVVCPICQKEKYEGQTYKLSQFGEQK